jgi:hypothetical protein
MKLKFIGVLIVFLGVLLCLTPYSSATLMYTGDPVEGGSWTQRFYETGVGSFDTMEIFMMTDDEFEPPGFSDFDISGWTSNFIRSDYVYASGTPNTLLYFNIRFDGVSSDSLIFDFIAWKDGISDSPLEVAEAKWTGSNWIITGKDYDPSLYNRSIPEPGILFLLGPMFIVLLGLSFKTRKEF